MSDHSKWIQLDGSMGEGGGQILRSALALSICTQRPFRIRRIRARRKKTGLMRQHLTCVRAATEICGAKVEGAEIGSLELCFQPQAARPGDYRFSVGSAGSTTLVLQSVLPALLGASAPSVVRIEGGTHNGLAPSFDFLNEVFLPQLARMGAEVSAELIRPGYYPAGGGELIVTIRPSTLRPIELLDRGADCRVSVVAELSQLPRKIAERELVVLCKTLNLGPAECQIKETDSPGPGNVLTVRIVAEWGLEMVNGFARRGLRAEVLARAVARECRAYLSARVPVGPHLADQLLVPFALAGGGSFRTFAPSGHTETNIDVIERFLPVKITVTDDGAGHLVSVRPSHRSSASVE